MLFKNKWITVFIFGILIGLCFGAEAITEIFLDDIEDCNVPSPNDGDVLTYDTATANWTAEAPTGNGVSILDDLTDVDTTGVLNNDFLKYSGGNWYDFSLFNTANTWLQTNTFNQNILVGNSAIIDSDLEVYGTSYLGSYTDYVEVTPSGVIVLWGDARVKRHVRVTAPSWAKGVTAPVDGFVDIIPVLSFDKSKDDEAHYSLIVPFRIETGSDISVVVNWCYTGEPDSGFVKWELWYTNIATGELVGNGAIIYEDSSGAHTSGTLITTVFTDKIVGAVADDILALKLVRVASADTLDTDAHLIQVHFKFTEDKLGEPIS